MTTLRSYVVRRALTFGAILLIAMLFLSLFSVKKVKDIYHQNLLHLSLLLEKNFLFFMDLYGQEGVLKYQLSEAVSKIPHLEAIYIEYEGKEFAFPLKWKEELRSACARGEEKVFEKNGFIVVCLPLKEEYATLFIESESKGKFVALFNRLQEERFISGWVGSSLLLFFLIVGMGFMLMTMVWSEVGENFVRLERVIHLVEEHLSKEEVGKEERKRVMRELRELSRSFTIREFKKVELLLVKLMRRVEELNREVKKLAVTDPLTGLYNRNYLKLFVEGKLMPMWRRERFPLSVALLDIDNFKQINDTFGHQKGDEILKRWGELIKKNLRGGDVAVRYGGEEVLIIFPYTLKEEAAKALERLKRELSKVDFGIGRPVTFSGGVAGYPGDLKKVDRLEVLISLADERLYRAKRSGKNRIIWEG